MIKEKVFIDRNSYANFKSIARGRSITYALQQDTRGNYNGHLFAGSNHEFYDFIYACGNCSLSVAFG
ncbi:MAG: hypothetical protein JWP81_4725 [Ferruginibacter sp.]|nr:hypothetical protein [Ferruginibacter sp.]